jgi:hypothetical protein
VKELSVDPNFSAPASGVISLSREEIEALVSTGKITPVKEIRVFSWQGRIVRPEGWYNAAF